MIQFQNHPSEDLIPGELTMIDIHRKNPTGPGGQKSKRISEGGDRQNITTTWLCFIDYFRNGFPHGSEVQRLGIETDAFFPETTDRSLGLPLLIV